MGVQIDKPIVNLRNILDGIFKPKWFELPKRKWFSNLVINGTFDTDVNWTKGTNWRIDDTDSNVADQSVATASDLTQTVNTIIGTKYSIVFTTTSRTVGTLTLNMDLVTVGSTATNETVTLIFTVKFPAGSTEPIIPSKESPDVPFVMLVAVPPDASHSGFPAPVVGATLKLLAHNPCEEIPSPFRSVALTRILLVLTS